MTPSTQPRPEQGRIAALPATLAGLWTAITLTHDVATRPVELDGPDPSECAAMVAAACARAAESLALSRQAALQPADVSGSRPAHGGGLEREATDWANAWGEPRLHSRWTDERLDGVVDSRQWLGEVSALLGECIDLAVELLGNEDEPLTQVEVLAVTRAVTALCAARSLAHAGPA